MDLREGLFTRKEAELAIRKCEIHTIGTSVLARIKRKRREVEISVAAVYDPPDGPAGVWLVEPAGRRAAFLPHSPSPRRPRVRVRDRFTQDL